MLAVVTGASSGIGRDIARELAMRGFDLVLVARNRKKLEELKSQLPSHCRVLPMDLSVRANAQLLHSMLQEEPVDVLVNNAGFGSFGFFQATSLKNDLNMIDLNICAMHTLTKLFARDFIRRDHGFILNVSSSAGFMPGGPLMAAYYASKAYVLSLSEAIYEELRRQHSHASISVLCPGPVNTGFNDRAGVRFSVEALSSRAVAQEAIGGLFQKKLMIIPGGAMKLTRLASKLLPDKFLLRAAFRIQHAKRK